MRPAISLPARTPADRRRLLRIAALGPKDAALSAWRQWREDADPWRFDPASEWWLPLIWWNLRGTEYDITERTSLRDEYTRVWIRNTHLLSHVAPVLRAWRREGIETLLLKGAALAATAYPRSGLRPFGDVDVLVKPQDAPAAHEILARLGWVPSQPAGPAAIATLPSLSYTNQDGVDLDLHQHALAECCAPESDTAFWRRSVPATIDEVDTRVLCPGDQLLHVCAHGLRFAPVPTAHWMADAATLIQRAADPVVWDTVIAEARARQLTVQLHSALTLLEPEYVSVPREVLGALAASPAPWWERAEARAKRRQTRPWAVVQAWCVEARTRTVATAGSIGFANRLQAMAGARNGRELAVRTALAVIGRRPRGRTHAFDAYERRIEITLDDLPEARAFLASLADRLPRFGACRRPGAPDRIYQVLPFNGVPYGFRVLVNRGPLGMASTIDEAADQVVIDLQSFLATAVKGRTFVHAGVVTLHGRAIVLPGESGSGKSTLVAALLRAGAAYGSDEFAILDERGHVHAFPRPLRLRRPGGAAEYVRPSGLGARVSTAPLAASVVLFSVFRPSAVFAPERLSSSTALLRLLSHCPGARGQPAQTMATLGALVEATPAWATERGDTDAVVRALVENRL